MRLAVALLLITIAMPAFAEDDDMQMVTINPEQIGQIFCIARLGNDMAPVEGILTAELKQAIADADDRNAAYEDQYPGEKPPLGDGVPWQAWPDYAPVCTVGDIEMMTGDARVELRYSFPDDPAAGFVDTLILRKVDQPDFGVGFWRIDNVAYSTGSDLKAELVAAFEGVD